MTDHANATPTPAASAAWQGARADATLRVLANITGAGLPRGGQPAHRNGRDGSTDHPCDVRFGAEVVAVLEAAERLLAGPLDARAAPVLPAPP